jgi:menaquinone-dependent protoporphyrinogen oxidase
MRILVTAASKYGSTSEIARQIGDILAERGHVVTVEAPAGADVAAHDAVVLGSAVYAGHWLPAAKDLAERSSEELASRPTWLFSSGPVGDPPKPEEDPADVGPILVATKANEHRIFAGKIDRQRLSFPERAIVAALRVQSGDFRRWDEVEAWATRIADFLGARTEDLRADPATGNGP